MRITKTSLGHRNHLIALAVVAAVSATCLHRARGQVTATLSGSITADYSSSTGKSNNTTYSFVDASANLNLDVPVIPISATASGFWSDPLIWNGAPILLANDGITITGIFADLAGAFLNIPAEADTLINSGPTEQSVSIPGLDLESNWIPGVNASLSVGANLTYDVTIPTGISVQMDQPTVAVHSLFVESGATLTGNGGFTVRTDLYNQGTLYGLGGTIQGNFDNAGPHADITGALAVQGILYNSGTLSIESGASLNLSQPFTNIGTVNLYGGSINAPGPLTNTGTFNAAGDSTINTPFNNTGGTIDVAAGMLYLSGGGISTGGTIAAGNGVLNFSGGTQTLSGSWIGAGGAIGVSGSGVLQVASGSAVVLANTAIQITGGSVGGEGTLSVNGGIWTGGNIIGAGGLINTGTFIVDNYTGNNQELDGVLTNAGTILQGANSNHWISFASGTLNNLAGATYDIQSGDMSGGAVFNNAGLLEKSSNAAGDSTINTPFNNTGGTIDVAAGMLYLSGGGISTGGTIAAGNGVLNFSGGTQTLSGSWIGAGGAIGVSGSGVLQVASGSAVVLANTAIQITGGSVGGEGTLSVNGGIWTGGNIIGAGGLINTGTFIVDNYTGNNQELDGVLTNAGTILQGANSNHWISFASGTLNNLAGAIYDIQSGDMSGGAVFNNAGLLEKSSNAAGDSTINTPFNNTGGTIDVAAGMLYLSGGGISTGGTIAAGNGVLNFSGGTQTLSGSWIGAGGAIGVSGSGVLQVASGSAVVLANTAIQITGGSVGGEGTLSVNGGIWTGGNIIGAGGLINTGTFIVDNYTGNNQELDGVLTNAGTILQGANSNHWISFASGTLNNLAGATYDIQSGDMSGGAVFNNAGLLEKSSNAAGDSTINIPFNNNGNVEVDSGTLNIASLTNYSNGTLTGGTYEVASGGTLALPGAIATNAATITINGAGSSFSGLSALTANTGTLNLFNGASLSTAGGLTNSGKINLDPSTLDVNGNFSQASDGILMVTLDGNGAGQYGLLNVTGTANLAGTLDLSFINGYIPRIGDSFTVLNYSSYSGMFSTIQALGNPNYQFAPQYTSSGLVLTTTAVPEPAPLLILLAGGSLALLRRRRKVA